MELVLKEDEFHIWRDKKCSIFKIEFKNNAYKIINSLIKTRIISGASTDDSYKIIKFKAESVKSLKEFLEYSMGKHGKIGLIVPDIAKMIRSMSLQLSYLLENEFSTIIGYNPENIIVINDEKFAFLGSELVAKLDEDTEHAMISCPFITSDFFVSPELLNIREIPAYVHYKTSYFSLACLILFGISGDDEFYRDFLTHKQPEKILDILNNHPIKSTKIYWLLSRCLVEEVNNRSIILL